MLMSGEQDGDPSVAAYDSELVPLAEPMVIVSGQFDLVAPELSSRIVDLACGGGLIVRHLFGRNGTGGGFLSCCQAAAASFFDRDGS